MLCYAHFISGTNWIEHEFQVDVIFSLLFSFLLSCPSLAHSFWFGELFKQQTMIICQLHEYNILSTNKRCCIHVIVFLLLFFCKDAYSFFPSFSRNFIYCLFNFVLLQIWLGKGSGLQLQGAIAARGLSVEITEMSKICTLNKGLKCQNMIEKLQKRPTTQDGLNWPKNKRLNRLQAKNEKKHQLIVKWEQARRTTKPPILSPPFCGNIRLNLYMTLASHVDGETAMDKIPRVLFCSATHYTKRHELP